MRKSALIGIFLFFSSAHAYVDMEPKNITLSRDSSQVVLTNKGERTEYIEISLSRLMNPGVDYEHEKRVPIQDIDSPSILVTPFKMMLKPGQSKPLQIKKLTALMHEEVYRLSVRPQLSVIQKELTQPRGGVALNISYEAIIRVLPATERKTFLVICTPGQEVIRATGNQHYHFTNVELRRQQLEPFNVYPETPWRFSGGPLMIDGKSYC